VARLRLMATPRQSSLGASLKKVQLACRVEAKRSRFGASVVKARLRLMATPRQSSLSASLKRRLVEAAGVEPRI
jgi:hypothetical protein